MGLRLAPIAGALLISIVSVVQGGAAEGGPLFGDFPRWLSPVPDFSFWEEFPTGPGGDPSALVRVRPEDLPALPPEGDLSSLRDALTRQLRRCGSLDGDAQWRFGERVVRLREWCQGVASVVLEIAGRAPDMTSLWNEARGRFEWYRSTGSDGQGAVMYTGYYTPLMRGARARTPRHTYPLYRKPDDLVRAPSDIPNRGWRRRLPDGSLVPYFDRREIDWDGAIEGQGLEIAYVDDPMEAFFLHIQGSGALLTRAADGSVRRTMVNYAATNGHPYVAIGRVLRSEGVPEEYLTLQGLRRYFQERPSEIDRVLPMNPSYVFFSEEEDGPYGSGGTKLAPGHSIATDNSIFPLGALAFIFTRRPDSLGANTDAWIPFSRLAVNQDTGGAIRGAGRVDVFWGEGAFAELTAGQMKEAGELYFAIPPAGQY